MARKSRVEYVLDKHYRDMLELNQRFISTMGRPRILPAETSNLTPQLKRKPSKKQLRALAAGRKKLSDKRAKTLPF